MNRKLSRKITDQHRGIYTRWCSIPTGAPFSFFLLLKTPEKLMKNEFSLVVEKRGICTRKVFISDYFRGDTL
jgi:hypothetical protein